MADKTYKMTVTLSDGSTIDAGMFVAPQGPKGDTGTIPEALPQEASALKSGNLPTDGWSVSASLWTGSVVMPYRYSNYVGKYIGNVGKSWASSEELLAELPDGWQATINGVLYTKCKAEYSGDDGGGIIFIPVGYYDDGAYVRILLNGDIHVWNNSAKTTRTITQVGCSRLSKQTYTISDSDITANSDVLMELTDDGGVKSYSMEAGKITVIRDTVPTSPIPYTYKVKQTNASGQFTLVNHYVPNVPVTSVNGQTGAVTIAVPTKTSELTNDSGFITSADIPSAGEWVDVTGETATLTQAGTYQVLFGASYRVQSIIYWDGTNGADGIYSTVATAVSNNRISITSRYPSVTAGGVLSIYFATVTADNGVWTEETTAQSGFKYRKIN